MQTPQQIVASLYLAYFGRPGDPSGISYWTDALAHGMTLDAVTEAFSKASEFGGRTPQQQITNIYQQLLGRDPEPLGAAYWLGEVNAGRLNPAQMALNIYNGASGTDAVVVGARQDVADQFTVLLGANDTTYNGPSDTNIARLIIQSTNGTTPPADAAALAALGVKLVADASADVITALVGANGNLSDLLNTPAGKADPLALVKLVDTIVTAAAGNSASLTTLLGTGTLTDLVTNLRPGVTLTELDTAITGGGLQGGAVVVNPPVNPPVDPPVDPGPAPDTTAPVLASAAVNGDTLVLTYTDAGLLEATNKPGTDAFDVQVGSTPNAVTAVVVDANAKTVTLTLTTPVLSTDTVTVGYTAPTADAANTNAAIQDAAGNDAASLTANAVVNSTPPVVTSITGTQGDDTIDLTAAFITYNDTAPMAITGGEGADTTTLRTAGTASDTIVFDATAALNGEDTITGFQVGDVAAGGDVLDFSGFLGGVPAVLTNVVADSATDNQEVANKNILRVTDAGDDLDAAGIANLFGGTDTAFGTIHAGDKYVLITDAGKVWFIDTALEGDADALTAGDIVQVGLIDTVVLTGLVDANFGASIG